MQRTVMFGERRVLMLLPKGEPRLCVWIPGGEESEALEAATDAGIALCLLQGLQWNDDLSPWPAPACFRGDGGFGGRAADTLRALAETILPEAEREACLVGCPRAAAGYSLAGLFSLYALLETELFCGAASVSGSLWFDGFDGYLRDRAGRAAGQAVYLSLGDAEARTRNPRLAPVEERTAEAARILADGGAAVREERNPGNHFQDPDGRLCRGILALAEMLAPPRAAR